MLTRHVQRACWIAGAILAAFLFFVGGAAVRLMMGPISLGPFAGAIEDSINSSISGLVVRFDQAVLEWSRSEGKVNLIILGTRVSDLDGRIVAQAPKADIDFDAAALISGRLSLKRFSLIGVQLTGLRTKDGEFRLGFGAGQGTPDILENVRGILQNSEQGSGSLQSFAIRDARLAFSDEPTGLFIVSPNASFTLQEGGGRLNAVLEAAIELAGVPSRVRATAALRANGVPERGTLEVHGLSLPALADNSTFFAGLGAYRLISDLNTDFSMGETGRLVEIAFHASGAGTIDSAQPGSPFQIDKFELDGNYADEGKRLTLKSFSIGGKQVSGKAHADLTFVWGTDGLARISGDATAENVKIALPALFREPLTLASLRFTGAYDLSTGSLEWERASLRAGALSGDFSGKAVFAPPASPALKLSGTIGAIPVRDLLRYWPKSTGEGAFDWIEGNVLEGRFGPAKVEVDLPSGAMDEQLETDEGLTVSIPFEGATIRYMPEMSPITGARGQAVLLGKSFKATIAEGSVGPIALSAGDIVLDEIHRLDSSGVIDVHAEGQVPEILALIDEPPLNYPTRFGLDPKETSGKASLDLNFVVPMRRDVAREEIGISVAVKASSLSVPLDGRMRLENGDATFDIDGSSLAADGTGAVDGVPVKFNWTESFASEGDSTRIDVVAVLNERSRPILGLTQPDWVKGALPFTASLFGRRFHFTDVSVEADATGATAEFDAVNLIKRAGTPAAITAQVHFADGGAISVNNLAVVGEGLDVRGDLEIDETKRLTKISLSQVRAGTENDFSAGIAARNDGGLDVILRGAKLDGSRLFASARPAKAGAPPSPPQPSDTATGLSDPLSIDAKIDHVALRENFAFRDVAFEISYGANERIENFSLDATEPAGAKVTGKLVNGKGARELVIESGNAGNFVRGFTGFSSISGGTLTAKVSLPSELVPAHEPVRYGGTVDLSNFVVTNQPFMSRLFAAGSLDGPLRLLQGDGIAVTRFSAPFAIRGKQVTIRDGRFSGPAIGASFEGTLDRASEQVDVSGTLVPVYGLNSMLGVVPVLGDLLVSKQGEGIFGLTYAMRGDLNEPALAVNPLSVLTPGIFRRIFEFSVPKDIQAAPQNAAVPAPRLE
jgi:Protein of unknown function/AsmA-like C-terminal region